MARRPHLRIGIGLEQDRTPLLQTLLDYSSGGLRPLHTPAHKQGTAAPPALRHAMGDRALRLDLPSMRATDNTFHPNGCIAEAEALAAETFGAGHTRMLAGGASLGVMAAVLASVTERDALLIPRNVHRSVLSALVLSGARPVYLMPEVDPRCGALAPTPAQVSQALDRHPEIRAMLLTRPTYYGVAGDLDALTKICRTRGVKILVDEAHGSHLHFLPKGTGPRSAVQSSVDAVIQSPHKTLGAMVGGAFVHLPHASRLTPERLGEALNLLQTTSPSYLVLSSLDAVRHWMYTEGETMFTEGLERIAALRRELSRIPHIEVLEDLPGHRLDPFRLVIDVRRLGRTGFEVERFIREHHGIEDELCDSRSVVYVLGPRDDPGVLEDLVHGFRTLSNAEPDPRLRLAPPTGSLPPPTVVRSPREAAFSPKQRLCLADSLGRIAGEVVTPYPPGIPLLCPGEVVTPEILDTLRHLKAQRATVHASDDALDHLIVLAD